MITFLNPFLRCQNIIKLKYLFKEVPLLQMIHWKMSVFSILSELQLLRLFKSFQVNRIRLNGQQRPNSRKVSFFISTEIFKEIFWLRFQPPLEAWRRFKNCKSEDNVVFLSKSIEISGKKNLAFKMGRSTIDRIGNSPNGTNGCLTDCTF